MRLRLVVRAFLLALPALTACAPRPDLTLRLSENLTQEII